MRDWLASCVPVPILGWGKAFPPAFRASHDPFGPPAAANVTLNPFQGPIRIHVVLPPLFMAAPALGPPTALGVGPRSSPYIKYGCGLRASPALYSAQSGRRRPAATPTHFTFAVRWLWPECAMQVAGSKGVMLSARMRLPRPDTSGLAVTEGSAVIATLESFQGKQSHSSCAYERADKNATEMGDFRRGTGPFRPSAGAVTKNASCVL